MKNQCAFKNKSVLVTGATGGIGRLLCKKFVDLGSKVYAVGRNRLKLDDLESIVGVAKTYSFDLNNLDDIDSLNQLILRDSGGIDILINNAGIFFTSALEEIDKTKIEQTFNINVFAPILMSKFHSGNMKKKGWGRIFNIGSSSAYSGGELTSLYCSSKHALLGLSRSLSKELKPFNIRVCNLSPSSTKTDMGRIPLSTYQDYDTFINPEEVSEVLVFLSSFDGAMEVKEILLNRVEVQ